MSEQKTKSTNPSSNNTNSDYCYITGFEHGSRRGPGDPINDAIQIAPCNNPKGSEQYGKGYVDGVNKRDGTNHKYK